MGHTPLAPVFPMDAQDCRRYADELGAFRSQVSKRHDECLQGNGPRCPSDAWTGCSCLACAQFHGSPSSAGVSDCYNAIPRVDERVTLVNEVLTNLASDDVRLVTKDAVRDMLKDAGIGADLARAASLARAAASIASSLRSLQENTRSGDDPAASRAVVAVLSVLARKGLARNPVSLLLTDVALDHVAKVNGDALAALDQELSQLTREWAQERATAPSMPQQGRRPAPAPAPVRDPGCAVLADDAANRDLMTRDSAGWMALVRRCNP